MNQPAKGTDKVADLVAKVQVLLAWIRRDRATRVRVVEGRALQLGFGEVPAVAGAYHEAPAVGSRALAPEVRQLRVSPAAAHRSPATPP